MEVFLTTTKMALTVKTLQLNKGKSFFFLNRTFKLRPYSFIMF